MSRYLKTYFYILLFSIPVSAYSQKKKELSIAITNSQSAYPYHSFRRLFTGTIHPGVEVGYGFNWQTKPKHDWCQSILVGYFYHRFVMHAIPLYSQFGYRYKPTPRVNITATVGLGYLHFISDNDIFKLNSAGDYVKDKGIGRPQAIVNFNIGAAYTVSNKNNAPKLFMQYRQQLQTPFIKSYVPLLPYNIIVIGCSVPLK